MASNTYVISVVFILRQPNISDNMFTFDITLIGDTGEDEARDGQGERRIPPGGQRNARARMRAAAAAAQQQQGADVEDEDLEKMGAKKRAKMEAKAEKKAQREVEEREREEKKRKKEAEDEERRKAAEREQAIEAKREEDERKAKEERERREQEEYMKMKEAFNVEEEGYDANDQDQETLLCDFINYIKNNKVVLLEDLAAHFKLKTQDVISRIHDLQAAGTLTGVIDDRGKFIYVSQTELEGVAKFVKQRGRVSIAELAENSQRLIDLSPVVAST